MKNRFFLGMFLSTVLLWGFIPYARADFPERPITMVVNYSAGGGTDLCARAVAKRVEKILGQPIIVVNKSGAGGTIGVGALATTKPDGYTIGVVTFTPLTVAPHIYDIPYNPLKDFEYIMGYAKYLYGTSVRSDSPFKTLKDLVQYAKANPGKIKYGVQGLSIPNHFAMVRLCKAEGIKMEPVVYKNTMEEVAACLGGHIDVTNQDPPAVVPHIQAGKLRLLASFSDVRWKWVPDVPTVKEMGYNFYVESWAGLGAPKGVPKPIMEKLRDAFKKSVDSAEFLEIIDRIRLIAEYLPPEQFKKLVEDGYKENEAMVLELGLHKSQKK